MNRKELLTATRKSKKVYCYCIVSEDDGVYLTTTKADIAWMADNMPNTTFNATLRDDGNLYIN